MYSLEAPSYEEASSLASFLDSYEGFEQRPKLRFFLRFAFEVPLHYRFHACLQDMILAAR